MDLELITEGAKFTLYGMTAGGGVTSFLEKLKTDAPEEFEKLDRRLTQLAERGPSRRRTEFNVLGGGLFEMKTTGGARVVFFYDAGRLVICTQGFEKKSRKTPRRELDVARERKTAYERLRREQGHFRIFVSDTQKTPERRP